MNDRQVKIGDYILVTNPRESRYLKIGEVTDIEYYDDGDVKEYTVRFGYNYDTKVEDLERYRYDLPDRCRVLTFVDR